MPSSGSPGGSILVVGGTHGNERNAPWLLQQWHADPASLGNSGFALELVLGNPAAFEACRRYIDRDLNRCFVPSLLADQALQQLELLRARELLHRHGPQGLKPCQVVFDLHSTTAAMGNSLVLYGRRPADLALAAAMQQGLGLPVYLHEADPAQTGFLVEQWPCGIVIEVGPVPQGVIDSVICRQTQIALEHALDVLAEAAAGRLRLPAELVVHCHLGSVDLPRRADGTPASLLHPRLQGRDWQPLGLTDTVFMGSQGNSVALEAVLPAALRPEPWLWPVFVGEASYEEKGIAFSLTRKEHWSVAPAWAEALVTVSRRLQRGAPL